VIEILELITASKYAYTVLRFLFFNCGLLGESFGTLAMYSQTIVLLVYNSLGKKGNAGYKAKYSTMLGFSLRLSVTTRDVIKYRRSPGRDVNPIVRNTVQDDI